LLDKGGLGANPKVMTQVLQTTFGTVRDQPDANQLALEKLNELTATFAAEEDQKRLAALLEKGGLGAKPETLATILQVGCGGDSARLKGMTEQFQQEADLANLKGLVDDGGLGDDPLVLATVLRDSCDGQAERLKKLTDGYPA